MTTPTPETKNSVLAEKLRRKPVEKKSQAKIVAEALFANLEEDEIEKKAAFSLYIKPSVVKKYDKLARKLGKSKSFVINEVLEYYAKDVN